MAKAADSFVNGDGERQLVDCAVLYFDMLGVGTMAEGKEADRELREFERAIERSFRFGLGTVGSGDDAIVGAVFSDSFILAAPVQGRARAARAEAIANLIFEAASIQGVLAVNDYFVRGAITVGKYHMHGGLIFGPALVEAVRLEQSTAKDPRVILSPTAIEELREGRRASIAREPLLVDVDGFALVDYLTLLYIDPAVTARHNLLIHRNVVGKRLVKHAADIARWRKHRWVAEYHNDFLRQRAEELRENKVDVENLWIDRIDGERQMRAVKALLSAG